MRRRIVVEMRRQFGLRSTWGIVATMVGVAVVGALQTTTDAEAGKALWERQAWLLAAINGQLFLLVLGAKAVTDDFRYGTIVPSVLITPDRAKVVLAKLAALGVIGAGAAAMAAVAVVIASWGSLGNGLQADEIRAGIGYVGTGALFVPIGGAVGYVVRHQVGAIVGVIAWTMVLGGIMGGLDGLGDYLPNEAGVVLATGATTRTTVVAALILMTYAAAAAAASAVVMTRRDVI